MTNERFDTVVITAVIVNPLEGGIATIWCNRTTVIRSILSVWRE